jgi:GNAT superfamily N-acetyltransferase
VDSESLKVNSIIRKAYPLILELDYTVDLEELHELVKEGFGYYAKNNEELILYFIYRCKERRIIIDKLFVNPESRRRGIGKKIIKRLKDKMKSNYDTIEINVSQDDFGSHLFLSKMGFTGQVLDEDNYKFIYGA